MKKYFALILLSMSALVITSCGDASPKPPTTQDSGGTQGKDEGKDTVTDVGKEETEPEGDGLEEIGIMPGMRAPDFTLLDKDGKEVSLSDYKGKITFLNFWAKTCPYCIEEMPDLEEFNNEHKDDGDFALLGINMTKTWEKESKEDLVKWLDEEGFTFPVVFDVDGVQAAEWSARSLPVTFIIDADGISLGAIMGKTDKETLNGVLKEVRAGKQ